MKTQYAEAALYSCMDFLTLYFLVVCLSESTWHY